MRLVIFCLLFNAPFLFAQVKVGSGPADEGFFSNPSTVVYAEKERRLIEQIRNFLRSNKQCFEMVFLVDQDGVDLQTLMSILATPKAFLTLDQLSQTHLINGCVNTSQCVLDQGTKALLKSFLNEDRHAFDSYYRRGYNFSSDKMEYFINNILFVVSDE